MLISVGVGAKIKDYPQNQWIILYLFYTNFILAHKNVLQSVLYAYIMTLTE